MPGKIEKSIKMREKRKTGYQNKQTVIPSNKPSTSKNMTGKQI